MGGRAGVNSVQCVYVPTYRGGTVEYMCCTDRGDCISGFVVRVAVLPIKALSH